MKKKRRFIPPLLVFIIAQIAWVSLVGMWIYLYMSNYFILKRVGDQFSIELSAERVGVWILIGGFILLLLLLGGIYLIFVYLTKQVDIAKSYDSFIESVTHELKSPIASIQLYLETLKAREMEREKELEFVDLMLKDVERLKSLINTILDVSKLEQKRMFYEYDVYDFTALIIEIVREVAGDYSLGEDQVVFLGNPRCKIVANRDAVKVVVRNIIDNALKYTIGRLLLTVNLYEKKKYAVADFTDNGIGISLRDRKKVFGKFVRLSGRLFPSVKGTGLGLYIVREIVRYHHGRVDVLSRGKEKGSTFRVEFPIYDESGRGKLGRLLRLKVNNGS